MEKQKRWQFFLIVGVIALTLYNILPTIFYYWQPLKEPVGEERAMTVAEQVVDRLQALEKDSVDWIHAYADHLGLGERSVTLQQDDPRLIYVDFADGSDADVFRRLLPRAGAMITFQPAQLSLSSVQPADSTLVAVERRIGVSLEPSDVGTLFSFTPKLDADGEPTAAYAQLVHDRTSRLSGALAGTSPEFITLQAILSATPATAREQTELLLRIARDIVAFDQALPGNSQIKQRYFARYTMGTEVASEQSVQQLLARFDASRTLLSNEQQVLDTQRLELLEKGELLDADQEQLTQLLKSQLELLERAAAVVRKNSSAFVSSEGPLSEGAALSALAVSGKRVDLGQRHPFIRNVTIQWGTDRLILELHEDVLAKLLSKADTSEAAAIARERIQQLLINEIARIGRVVDEDISPDRDDFIVQLNQLTDSRSLLTLDLGSLAQREAAQLQAQLDALWIPEQVDLARDVYPIMDWNSFRGLEGQAARLGLVVYAPSSEAGELPGGFRRSSIYVIARGLQNVISKYEAYPDSDEARVLSEDVLQLRRLLADHGFFAYPASAYGMDKEFENDIIFELHDYYSNLLSGTREDFQVHGSHRLATLEFSDVEQRILSTNRIEEATHEDLLKWREEYGSAQVDLRPSARLLVPPPTKSAYIENLKINWAKYFRGDDRKILRWGLDLSGGKSVRIGLRDQANQPVTEQEDLKQAVNELYTRINKMGVSERSIRIENANILLDFPGVQGLSADELVKASAMTFHIMNEKFSVNNPSLKDATNAFLQEVWNEAVVTNRQDVESINEIAWQHMGGDLSDAESFAPRSEAARSLYESGLRLAPPSDKSISNAFNDTVSSIAVWRGDDMAEWHGQTHPLLVVFRNYALEGSNLQNVQANYDPSHGNILTFSVAGSYSGRGQQGDPREDFYAWTSQFAKSKVAGTIREAYSRGEGWRMVVVLNGTAINAPTLNEALRDHAMIHGNFSQREVNRLAADLKAGSLSFTPKILSETNVSPDLGQQERFWGISAALLGLCLVVVAMCSYYRFAGIVASCAVLLNLLIMWGVLQNLGAALTLPGIAGIILTVGMAVDANVLVFERIREEFKISGRIASAVAAGYRKAFSAIADSNVTTLIAALILIAFDSGPIRGFAIVLIIGICSSMFTALFMTRYFFAGWVRNPKNTELKMSNILGNSHFNFLKHWKTAATISLCTIVAGCGLLYTQWASILGMDFTGGYAVTVRLEERAGTPLRTLAVEAFDTAGALAGDVEVRELNRPNQLRIQMGFSMDEEGHVFHGLPELRSIEAGQPEYLRNPRLTWVVSSLEQAGLEIKASSLESIDQDWNVMSGQFSEVMRNNALMALACALTLILFYLTFRFEFKYAISAIIALTHDVLISLSVLGIFYWIGVPVQLNLEVMGAIMTIIGYSLNDTIIIFDRIREDVRLKKKLPLEEVVNNALNVTLSRTLITSGTTLLVLLALVFLGGSAIFDLALVMTVGVIFGTISSLFIASPAMLYFHRREERRQAAALSPTRA